MVRRATLSEIAFADDTQDSDLPVEWARGAAYQILEWLWISFDRLRSTILHRVDFTKPLDQLERDLTRNHFLDLQAVFLEECDGFSSIVPTSEWPEMETRKTSQAKPPAYDFAFVHFEHRRWAWPIEAKVLSTPGTWHDYMSDVRDKFEAGIAAPLVGEGGMIAYLISGTAELALASLSTKLSESLEIVPEFGDRPHRATMHNRLSCPKLRLHHMIMMCN